MKTEASSKQDISGYIEVESGEVKVSSLPVILNASALGSCVAVVAWHEKKKIGGIAHIMLADKYYSKTTLRKTAYCGEALPCLFTKMKRCGAQANELKVYVIGGANILDDASLPDSLVEAVLAYLREIKAVIAYKDVGGRERRKVRLDIAQAAVYSAVGEKPFKKVVD